MKILQVITSLQIGGAEKLLSDIVPMLKQRGYEVDVLIFYGKDTPLKQQLHDAGVHIIEFSQSPNVYKLSYIGRLKKLMAQYDIIHTHNTSPQYFAAMAKYLSSAKTTTQLVTTEHSTNNRRRKKWWFKPIDKFIYRQYAKIICISDIARTNLSQYLHREKDIITIQNGVDVKKFMEAIPYTKNELLGLDDKAILITQVAGFRYEKDQDTLIKALPLLPPHCHLVFVGDGDRRILCEKLAEENGIRQRVHFLGIRTDVPRILKTADIIVMSSHWEGLSLSSVEGMCAGKPFLASNVQGLKEVVAGAGILFEHENIQQFADNIQNLIDNKSLYETVATKCMERAKQYDISKMVDGYEQVYLELRQNA